MNVKFFSCSPSDAIPEDFRKALDHFSNVCFLVPKPYAMNKRGTNLWTVAVLVLVPQG